MLSRFIALVLIVVLRVPFQSQKAPDWWTSNDCGPAVAAMLIEYYTDETYHPFDYYNEMNRPLESLQTITQMQDYLGRRGVTTYIEWDWTFEQLTEMVNEQKKPVIVGVHVPGSDHFMIVVGITDYYIYVHDPLQLRGYDRIELDEFKDMWYYTWSWQHNLVLYPEEVKEYEFSDPIHIWVIEPLDRRVCEFFGKGLFVNECETE